MNTGNTGGQPQSAGDRDDLFSPTLQGRVGRRTGEKPWRLQSQFWVAFFGGALAATVIAYLNGTRLGLSERRRRAILLTGAAGLLATVALSLILGSGDVGAAADRSAQSAVRLGGRVIAVIAYLVFYRLQKAADHTYSFYSQEEDEYASLWKPGLAAVFGLGIVQGAGVLAVVAVLRGV